MRRIAALALAVLAAAVLAGGARADGDPASDYLIQQQVFLPYDAKIPAAEQSKLLAAVKSANKHGFTIRVALIWSDYDLGAVTALWKQPRRYARFLGAELTYYFHGRLLIVMPNGFGFNWPKHDAAPTYRALAKLHVQPTPSGLAEAGTAAVEQLAAAAGVHASTSGTVTTSDQNQQDRIVIVVAVLVALLLGAAARWWIRRRARASG